MSYNKELKKTTKGATTINLKKKLLKELQQGISGGKFLDKTKHQQDKEFAEWSQRIF